jgi:hypothetical protein
MLHLNSPELFNNSVVLLADKDLNQPPPLRSLGSSTIKDDFILRNGKCFDMIME